jgi:hypothetical protein
MNITLALDLWKKILVDIYWIWIICFPLPHILFTIFYVSIFLIIIIFTTSPLYFFIFCLYLFTHKITQFQLQCCGRRWSISHLFIQSTTFPSPSFSISLLICSLVDGNGRLIYNRLIECTFITRFLDTSTLILLKSQWPILSFCWFISYFWLLLVTFH